MSNRYLNIEYQTKYKIIDYFLLKGLSRYSYTDLDVVFFERESKEIVLIETKYTKDDCYKKDPNNEYQKLRSQLLLFWRLKKNSNEKITLYLIYYNEPPKNIFSILEIIKIDDTEYKHIHFKRTNCNIKEYRDWLINLNKKSSKYPIDNIPDFDEIEYNNKIKKCNNIIKECQKKIRGLNF